MLACWFPQITCRRHKVYTTTLFTLVFQAHSITDLVQQLYLDFIKFAWKHFGILQVDTLKQRCQPPKA